MRRAILVEYNLLIWDPETLPVDDAMIRKHVEAAGFTPETAHNAKTVIVRENGGGWYSVIDETSSPVGNDEVFRIDDDGYDKLVIEIDDEPGHTFWLVLYENDVVISPNAV